MKYSMNVVETLFLWIYDGRKLKNDCFRAQRPNLNHIKKKEIMIMIGFVIATMVIDDNKICC